LGLAVKRTAFCPLANPLWGWAFFGRLAGMDKMLTFVGLCRYLGFSTGDEIYAQWRSDTFSCEPALVVGA